MSIASRSPPTSPPVGFRTETTAAQSSSARGASTWSGSEYRHRPRTVAPPRRSRASESAPSRPTRAGSGSAACGRQEEVVADPGEHRIDALTRFEVREHDGAPAALLAGVALHDGEVGARQKRDRKSTRLNSSHANNSYAVFCLKKKNITGSWSVF